MMLLQELMKIKQYNVADERNANIKREYKAIQKKILKMVNTP